MTLTTISGLPAHVLLVQVLVVWAPLTALLGILCALWPAARRSLVWLVLAFAVVTTALTPVTANAGESLYDRERDLAVAVLAIAVGAASIVQVVRVGDSGAQSVWGNELTKSDKP